MPTARSAAGIGVEVEKTDPSGLQPRQQHSGEALVEFGGRLRVHRHILPQVLRVDGDRFDGLQRPRIELPAEGGGHPAEPDDVTRLDGVDDDGSPSRGVDLNGHPSPGDEEDGAGILALPEEQGTRVETCTILAASDRSSSVPRETPARNPCSRRSVVRRPTPTRSRFPHHLVDRVDDRLRHRSPEWQQPPR